MLSAVMPEFNRPSSDHSPDVQLECAFVGAAVKSRLKAMRLWFTDPYPADPNTLKLAEIKALLTPQVVKSIRM